MGGGNRRRNGHIFYHQRTRSHFLGFSLRFKVSSKLSENCNRKRGNRQTHTDAGDFIICPMLCYSNGADKNV